MIVYTHKIRPTGCKYFNDECIQIACERFGQHLLALHIGGCDDVTDAGILHVSTHCRALELVDFFRCASLTEQCLTHLHTCSTLKSVLLKKCTFVSDAGVIALVPHLPQLTKLDLNSCNITDASLQAIAENCANLRELDVCICHSVNKSAVQYVVASIPGLICSNFWQFYL